MTDVHAPLARGRSVAPDDFADLTDVPATVSWGEGGEIVVTFAEPVPDDVAAAVRRRVISRDAREEQVRAEAEAFDPTTAELAELRSQVARLTEIITGRPVD